MIFLFILSITLFIFARVSSDQIIGMISLCLFWVCYSFPSYAYYKYMHEEVKKYKSIYKEFIVLEAFKDVFANIHYDMNKGLNEKIIRQTHMIDMGDKYTSNDYIHGNYKNVNFHFADIEIIKENKNKNNKRTYLSTIFLGQWFIFDFNKYFSANLQIREKDFEGAKLGNSWFFSTDYHKVELEDMDFNTLFDVYAIEPHDAFYILTPNTMEKIKELNKKIPGKLLFSFINNRLHIAIHNNKDFLEPKILKKIVFKEEKARICNEIKIIMELIDILNLDNTLFKPFTS